MCGKSIKGENSMAQKIELKGKSFLTLKDFSKEEIKYFLSLASYLKTKKKIGIKDNLLIFALLSLALNAE